MNINTAHLTHKQRIVIRSTQERYRFDPPAYESLKRHAEPFLIFREIFHGPAQDQTLADLRRLKGIWKTVRA